MNQLALNLVVFWPLLSVILAWFFYRKQNGNEAWTGGPISLPKAMWLSFTVTTWFFMPIWFLLCDDFPSPLRLFFVFHLLSWWIRGPTELFMIYRWLNWSPRYGISHDVAHVMVCAILLFPASFQTDISEPSRLGHAAYAFSILVIVTTLAEILFAYLFFSTRTEKEREENVYFASNDPRWRRINRITAVVVVATYLYLFLQSIYLT